MPKRKSGYKLICSICRIYKHFNYFTKKNRGWCRECTKNYHKNYYQIHKKEASEYKKQWALKNHSKLRKYHKEYYKINFKKYQKWRKEQRPRIRKYELNKRKTNQLFKLSGTIRKRIYHALKRKGLAKLVKTEKLLGCSVEFFKTYLESKFLKGMTWDNHNNKGWHIDHIIPLASAKTQKELHKLCHYSNLQPLWASDNIKKGGRIIEPKKSTRTSGYEIPSRR